MKKEIEIEGGQGMAVKAFKVNLNISKITQDS